MKKIVLPALLATLFTGSLVSCSKKYTPPPKPELNTITLQPDSKDGQDCLVAYRETDNNLYADANHSPNPDVTAIRWSYNADGAGDGTNRTYIKFVGLSSVPKTAQVLEAKLSLFGVQSGVAAPLGNSYYPGSPYFSSGDNSAWLKRVTGDWTESQITWNNKPGTTDEDKASVPPSTDQWNYDALNIDVTEMVKKMVAGDNYGFCLQLKEEEKYRSLLFGSSEAANQSKRPMLVVKYYPTKVD